MLTQPNSFRWDSWDLYESYCLALEESELHRMTVERKRRKFRQLAKQGRLDFIQTGDRDFDLQWLWNLCAAELFHHRYHWFGFHARSDWALGLAEHGLEWAKPWRGEGRPVVLAEQGIGDEILMASCYHELKEDTDFLLECDNRLLPVFRRSFGVECIGRFPDKQTYPPRPDDSIPVNISRGTDTFIPCGDVPQLYRRDPSHFPKGAFLTADPDKTARYADRLPDKPYGVSWSGGGGELDPELLREDGNAVNLQYNGTVPWAVDIPYADFDDLFALVAAIGLKGGYINAVPTAVVHVGGSLGVPVNLVKPKNRKIGNIRWQFGKLRCDWYSSVRQYHLIGEWNSRYSKKQPKSLSR